MSEQPRLFEFVKDTSSGFIVSDSNADAYALLQRWRAWPGGALALTGPAGSGKSHLARMWAAEAGAASLSPHATPSQARLAFEAHGGRLVLDEADAGRDDEAVMLLLDLAREGGGAVLLAGRTPPADWPVTIPDLRSRFSALLTARIAEPDDLLLQAILRRLCRARFIELRENVAKYLAQHMERSFAAAHELACELDVMMSPRSHPIPYDVAREALERVEARRATRRDSEPA